MLERKPGREFLTGNEWLNLSTTPNLLGSSSCHSFMNSSLIRFCSEVSGGRTLGHLAVSMGGLPVLEALGAVDDEPRPGPDLLVYPADVLAEDAHADQLDPAEE